MVVLLQVQLVPCEELDTKHYGSGLPLVTKLLLIESKAGVGLQDRSRAIVQLSSWCPPGKTCLQEGS
jgi:hypothetical protein